MAPNQPARAHLALTCHSEQPVDEPLVQDGIDTVLLTDTGDTAMSTRFEYRAGDAYAVHAVFAMATRTGKRTTRARRDWVLDRELLLAGLTSSTWVGDGDVRVCRVDDNQLALRLETPSGRGVLLLDRPATARFLGETLVAIPLGTESNTGPTNEPNPDTELTSTMHDR